MDEKFIPTSKKLTWIFSAFYLISVVAVGIIEVFLKIDLSHLLNYVLPIQVTIIVFYFGKSTYENLTKIKGGVDQYIKDNQFQNTTETVPQSQEETGEGNSNY